VTLLGAALALLCAGGLITRRCARSGGPYRAGPWPGLTPAGAGVLLGGALLLASGQLFVAASLGSTPTRPLPDLPVLAASAFVPLALATRLTRIPGSAAAVCGAYLLPRSLLSLLDPLLAPPPLLLVPALVFDLALWLRAADLAKVAHVWPKRRAAWRTRNRNLHQDPTRIPPPAPSVHPQRHRGARRQGPVRAAIAGGLFGLTLAALEPPFLILLKADPATWSGVTVIDAAAACSAVCGLVALSVPRGGQRPR
jgi:hypothetical protein